MQLRHAQLADVVFAAIAAVGCLHVKQQLLLFLLSSLHVLLRHPV